MPHSGLLDEDGIHCPYCWRVFRSRVEMAHHVTRHCPKNPILARKKRDDLSLTRLLGSRLR